MPVKIPIGLLPSYSGLQLLCQCAPAHSTCYASNPSPTLGSHRPSTQSITYTPSPPQPRSQSLGLSHSYATIAQDPAAPHNDSHNPSLPHNWPTDPSPTPYQVLSLPAKARYTKRHFNHLVKLYHPDLTAPNSNSSIPDPVCTLPHHVRLERYRLIVAAHTILSDPAKRRAYDRHGAGWGGVADIGVSGFDRPEGRAREDVMRNATWEDWEDWYQKYRPAGEGSSSSGSGGGAGAGTGAGGWHPGSFMSHYAFVSLVVMFASVGWVGQAKRVEAYGDRLVQARDFVHDHSSKDLRRARMGSAGSSKDERIESWLRLSDPALGQEEQMRRYLPDLEVCLSGNVSERDVRS